LKIANEALEDPRLKALGGEVLFDEAKRRDFEEGNLPGRSGAEEMD
jgi:hypothetical protein